MTKLIAYSLHENPSKIIPGRQDRQWMDETIAKYAYRCLPLNIANSMGWEFLCPMSFTAEWNGRDSTRDIQFHGDNGENVNFVNSIFGHGILTMHIGYLIRTSDGIALWVRGAPNTVKDGIVPLDGIVETNWLSYTFSSNWKFTRPGKIRFEKDESFCFITPINAHSLDDVQPEIMSISDAPDIEAEYLEYKELRDKFNYALSKHDPVARKLGWQKWYFQGKKPNGKSGSPDHMTKLRLANPKVTTKGIEQ